MTTERSPSGASAAATGISRRAAVLGLAGWAGAPSATLALPARADTPLPSLRELGRRKGIEVGTAFSGHPDPRYRALVAAQVGLVTPEWCLKPGFLKPSRQGSFVFGPADEFYAFAREARLGVHGHALFWHGDPLTWARGEAETVRAYRELARTTMSRYPDTLSWDVANEIVADPGILWRDQAGVARPAELVASLFRDAAALAPGRILCLNDYNLECGRAWCSDKRGRMLTIVDELLARGVPVKAVGLQSHLSSRHGLSLEATRLFVRQLAQRGLSVHLSELDVNDVVFPDAADERDQQVAELYRAYLGAMLAEPAVTRITFWGLADFDHWMTRERTDDARPAADSRPALFDRDLKPKRAFWAVAECLEKASRRPVPSP